MIYVRSNRFLSLVSLLRVYRASSVALGFAFRAVSLHRLCLLGRVVHFGYLMAVMDQLVWI